MRYSTAALVVLFACTVCGAQEMRRDEDLPAEVQAVVDAAAAAPPEFQANALIQLARSPLVPTRPAKKLLLEKAFAVATNAQEPVKRESAVAAGQTRAGTSSRGFDLDLDALSLQTRVAEAMLPVDPAIAREQFAQVRPSLAPLACGDALIYQVSDFYTRAAVIFSSAFSAEDRVRKDDARFLQLYVTDLTSRAQVAGAAELLRKVVLPDDELDRLGLLFAWSLERIGGDSRSFFQAPGAPASVVRLIQHLKTRNLVPDRLIEALRGYLVRNLAADWCRVSPANERYWLRQVEDFNESIRFLGRSEGVRIADAEIASRRAEGEPQTHEYWQTSDAKQLRNAGEAPGQPVRLLDYLEAVNAWDGRSEETGADYLHQKASLYSRLLNAARAQPDRQQVLADFVAFLARYDMERESRSAWAVHLEGVVRTIRGWPASEQDAGFSRLHYFGNSAMKLRAMQETLAPTNYDSTSGGATVRDRP